MKIIEIDENNENYPTMLYNIDNRPKRLYVLGNLQIMREKCISIVGCRKPSQYGEKIAYQISKNISRINYITVSGLANGIDTYAHRGTVDSKRRTIAVLAHGLDMIYPNNNRTLAKDILKNGGALISEYPIGVKPRAEYFPLRNRIISGLSVGTIIIEAEKRSGALITANYAIDQGRRIFSVPGNAEAPKSEGTNQLIKEGAEIITDVNCLNIG